MQQRRRQLRPGAAERMAERDCASINVETFRIDWQFAQARKHLRGKGFVQLNQIDLIQRQPCDLQDLANRGNGADAEALGLDARGGIGDEPRERLKAVLLRE